MTGFKMTAGIVVMSSLFAAACGGGEGSSMGNMPVPAPAPGAAPSASGDVEVALTTTPNPPVTGENAFEVMVTSGGQPVTDGEVSVEFYMPAMGSMSEMRNTVGLTHEGGGRYGGMGRMMMAGDWTATVTVMRGGQTLGSEKIAVTAK